MILILSILIAVNIVSLVFMLILRHRLAAITNVMAIVMCSISLIYHLKIAP